MASRKKKLKMVNIIGAPGVGKSALRGGLFWLMKAHHLSVEEVSEFAKYLVLTGQRWRLQKEQLGLLAEQYHRQFIAARAGYEWAVTDSPLVLAEYYAPKNFFRSFSPMVAEVTETFENHNFFITRDLDAAPFETRGRLHGKADARLIEQQLRQHMAERSILYTEVSLSLASPWQILSSLGFENLRLPEER